MMTSLGSKGDLRISREISRKSHQKVDGNLISCHTDENSDYLIQTREVR